MAPDRSPSQKAPLNPGKPNSSSPSGTSRRMPTPGQTSRTGSVEAPTPQSAATGNDLTSQPMAVSASASDVTATEPPSASTTPAPYGTRSRGRNAAPRPNYAEDRDIDVDLEIAQPVSKSAKRSSGVSGSFVNGVKADSEEPVSSATSRKSLTAVNGANGAAAAKDLIPGTSSFSAKFEEGAAPTSANSSSRKRKQPASSTTSNAASGNAAKKIFTTAPGLAYNPAETNMVSFESRGAYLKDGKLRADDGTTYAVNDHVYLICEPPGEPYYLARIMEFLPSKDAPSGPIEALRVNWYYRPRDIQRKVADTRLVFASMHSDTCPLTSLRGKCQIQHLSEITDIDTYRKTRDCFWYDKMFDRYIHRYYDVIPTSKVINVPGNVKKVLDERWKFVLVEIGRRKELTSAVKTCKRCSLYAASNDSVDCAVCHSTYHMYCVRPVLTKKPARGFAWACAACSRAQERKLEARNTPILGENQPEADEEMVEEEEEEPHGATNGTTSSTPAPVEEEVRPATEEQVAQARMWPYRYLGIHCRVEDALDYDDRIYPRASSRLGPRHQAMVNAWPGKPVEYVKPIDIKKKYMRGSGGRKDSKLSKETVAAIEAAKQEKANRPKWVMDEPLGYVRRGEDEPVTVGGKQVRTAEPMFKMPTADQVPSSRGEDDAPGSHLSLAEREKFVDDYMERAKALAPQLGEEKYATNFLDKALELLYSNSFNADAALAKLKTMNKYKDLKEPHLRPEELKLFEQAVSKFGSEWRNITKYVGTVPHYQIVRFYYMWKKTPRGRQIWGAYEGRRGKKEAKRSSAAKLVDDVADDHDDSAFDNDKAVEKKRGFQCKFCSTRTSRQWRRAPGTAPGTTTSSEPASKQKDKGSQLTVALCLRCALLWRKYGIQWESVDEVAKKIAQSGNKSWRRRVDEELLTQLLVSTETPISINSATAATAASIGVPVNANPQVQQETTKKKGGRTTEKDSAATSTATSVEPAPKKKVAADRIPEPPPIVPDPPRAKTLPCSICNKMEPEGDQHLSCRDCRLTVHRSCYGVSPSRNCVKWLCDMCSNDRDPMISTTYECVLCPVTWTEHELMEAPRSTHKKKTERDREKERLEKEMVNEAIKLYRQRQEAVGKPIGPREPLKRTAGNNWVHVTCAMWTPEIKFGNAKELEPAEGFSLIPRDRWRDVCKICKSDKGACVPCHFNNCNARFHVGCAFQAQYKFGFDITPIKSSRRDTVNSVRLGEEVGSASAGIWCPHHPVSATIHEIGEPTEEEGVNALRRYAEAYKQADLTLTGTIRKAAYVQQLVNVSHQTATPSANRRVSSVHSVTAPPVVSAAPAAPAASTTPKDNHKTPEDAPDEMVIDSENHAPRPVTDTDVTRKCARCSSSFSPRWWPLDKSRRTTGVDHRTPLLNGVGLNDPVGSRFSTASASPPYLHQTPSQHGLPRLNGEYSPEKTALSAVNSEGSQTLYECHKCHLKKPVAQPQPSPEPRPSPYSAQRPVLPAPKLTEYHNHPFGNHHGHPPQSGVLPRPMGLPHGGSEWHPGYEQRPADFGDSKLRNGLPVPGYRAAAPPPPPPPAHHMNGFPPTPSHHAPPLSHYPPGSHAPPQPFPTHQSPYGPVSMPSPHLSHATGPRPYAPSASPPDVQATMVRHSPQHSLSALNGGPPPRVYSVDRVLGAPAQSPPVSQAHMDPRGPTPPVKPEDTPVIPSAARHTTASGTNGGSGASASPSLKNLLS
ncbi:DNA-binding E3 ubiquitin-protein ligase SNT2 [Aspergillus tubingensis]|uniref:DNA-binding E3 ubiquitin-protein ligase SNT2 n=1 Tax=Aspergillus tubingensis TaxID=5068 RepID=UPI001578FB29|nr:PHD finger and BAH domain protein [Aspergillus tubingensis]GFN15546.1 PHD finger and BAH domain protein [Aspergillus tubingensis]